MRKLTILLACFLMTSFSMVGAQQRQISGTVLSAEDASPVIGASVMVKGSTIGSLTNVDGQFSLSVPDANSILEISFIGMTTVELPATNNMVVHLETDAKILDEVMVVAYGTAKKESFTGSAEVVSPAKLQKRTVANVSKALDGLVAGVQSTSGSGQPGASASIIVRGYGSINASQTPLYVVDGVPYDGSINAINPNDIEQMTVLKDASAGALYGSRGANGVVLITTKKGVEGNTQVNFKATWGVSSRAIPRYETLDEAGYIETVFHSYRNYYISNYDFSEADAAIYAHYYMANSGGPTANIFGLNEQYNPFNETFYVNDGESDLIDLTTGKVNANATLRYNQDWLDEITAKNPLRQEYVLTATGGTQKTKYMYSVGYLDEEGLITTTKYKRFSGRVNVETQLQKYITGSVGLSYSRSNSNSLATSSSATSNVFYSAQLMAPIYPVYLLDSNSEIVLDSDGNKMFDYGEYRPSGAQSNFNSVGTLFDDKYSSGVDNVSARSKIELGNFSGILEGLTFTINYGMDFQLNSDMTYYNPYNGNAVALSGSLEKESGKLFSFTTNQLLNYARSFGEHRINFLIGHEFYKYTYDYLVASKSGFPFGGLYELDAATTIQDAGSYQDIYAIQSVLSNFTYDFADRYYLSASLRKDGSSRFRKDDRWGTFWSVGASWRISEESFMENIDWLNNLTIKSSYGVQGNDDIGSYYAWQALYDLGNANSSLSGSLVNSLENTELSWEKNGNFNIGLEAKMFKSRLSATIEWYNRTTSDMLLSYPMPISSGFSDYSKNVGSMKNTGVDITLAGRVIDNNDFTWTVSVLGSMVKNEVLSLSDRPEIISGNYIIKEGEAVRSFYLPLSAGVDPETGSQLFKTWELDANGNKINEGTTSSISQALQYREVIDSRIPDLYGSIQNDFSYKGFDLSIQTNYSLGGSMIDGVYRSMLYSSYVGQAIHADRANAWKYPGDETDIPSLQFGTTYRVTDKDLINASYFSIKNITLGYTFSSRAVNSLNIESFRLFATADNLALFTHLKGTNPQYNFTGGTDFSYTPSRVISFGVDVNF